MSLTTQRLVERSLAQFADRVAVIDGEHTLTYGALRDRTGRLANALLAHGAGPEAPAAVLLPNDARVIEVDLACMRAGVTRIAVSPRLSGDECRFILEHSGTRVLVTSSELLERSGAAALPGIAAVLLVDRPPDRPGRSGREASYEATLSSASPLVSASPVAPDHPAYILYTSGTTGRPKGATHTHASRVAALVNMLASEIAADGTSAMVHCGPLSHGSGSKVLTFLALGARNIVLRRFEPEILARAVREHGGSHTFIVPTMLQMLLEAGPAVADAVRAMSQISFGGAPITNALFGRAIDAFGPLLTQVYGTSEAPHPVTVLKPEDYAGRGDAAEFAETAGRASHGTDLRILGDDGAELAPGGEGELWVRGAHLMTGYWRDPQASAEVFDADGWYATGDVALIDPDGFVRLRDRKRDLIISGGLNVYPSEVERVLAEHPNVREVAVIGYPDDKWGESVLACIVPHDAANADGGEIIAWLEGRIAGYKKPRTIEFMADLPKGSTNKVLKRDLKARFWEGRERRIN